MTHFTAPSFLELYDKLPEPIQELADKNYKLHEIHAILPCNKETI